MLHEVLLALSGNPSPLLKPDQPAARAASAISPPEQQLLASAAHISDLHIKLLGYAADISNSHPSTICRAVATAIEADHLAAFQRKVLEVEESILRKNSDLVGAYNIVPLTAVIGEFSGWTRRLEWLWHLVQSMLKEAGGRKCSGAQVIDRLRAELQTGYFDIEETARSLVRIAETAWVKQVSTWTLYGRIPSFGEGDFFVKASDSAEDEYSSDSSLLPSFVTPATATSMLFIGKSLNHIRVRRYGDAEARGMDHLSSQLKELSKLSYPLDSAAFSRTIASIRLFLSKNILQKLLPATRVLEVLQLLRDFFLIRRGEFAMALTHQADERMRSRWKRADNLAYEKREGVGNVVVKEGEVAAALARTWAAMGSMQGQHAEEDEGLELARDLLRLHLAKKPSTPLKLGASSPSTPLKQGSNTMGSTPFRNLLFSVPVVLSLDIPAPLDLFLSLADLRAYSAVNSYLLSIRRAHIRLTDMWKITSLRRHHPGPPGPPYGSTKGGMGMVKILRARHATRSLVMRSAWVTSSAAIFCLGETEGYLQSEVVAGLWEGFQQWILTGKDEHHHGAAAFAGGRDAHAGQGNNAGSPANSKETYPHDPETLATAHRIYLRALSRGLLLTEQSFTDTLYEVLVHIDHLVALVHRLNATWASMDLEEDVGVVDAFVDLEREEIDVKVSLKGVEGKVRRGVENMVTALRHLEGNHSALSDPAEDETGVYSGGLGDTTLPEHGQYIPRRVGGVDRLLMKLEFGSWFGSHASEPADEL